jgi:hypothetical protein
LTIHKTETTCVAGQTRRVAVLGAPGTGKTWMTTELMASLGRNSVGAASFMVADNPSLATVLPATDHETAGSRGFDKVLLMGLDLPSTQTRRLAQDTADQQLRQALAETGLPYTVVYGTGPARLAHALEALHELASCSNSPEQPSNSAQARRPWVWACDTCSDPDCERRLLSNLLASRAS